MKKIALLAFLGVVLSACNSSAPVSQTTPEPVAPTEESMMTTSPTPNVAAGPLTIQLASQNNSGQTGTVTLEEVSGKVKVSLALTGGTFTAPQPAHIHMGSCPTPGEVKYPLTNVTNGKSETMLEVNLNTLLTQGPIAVNVHKSAKESSVYTACANLTPPDSTPAVSPATGTTGY